MLKDKMNNLIFILIYNFVPFINHKHNKWKSTIIKWDIHFLTNVLSHYCACACKFIIRRFWIKEIKGFM